MAKTIQDLLADNPAAESGASPKPIRYVETVEAYDKWAEVYDTDGNFLQRLDTIEMCALLPRFLDRVKTRFRAHAASHPLILVDLGCGTGRNTIQMLDALSSTDMTGQGAPECQIVGLDASPRMLEVARGAIDSAVARNSADTPTKQTGLSSPDITLEVFDLLQFATTMAQLPPSLREPGAAGVTSTLVLEHIPAKQFFAAAAAIMAPGAYFLVTNMHADMGARSQAGFTDPATGVKIRPTSYCHSIPEVLDAADEAGFQVEDVMEPGTENGVLAREVDGRLAEVLGPRAKKWVGVKVWFGVCFSKRE